VLSGMVVKTVNVIKTDLIIYYVQATGFFISWENQGFGGGKE